ncbi:methylenetetrahydrofolate reductase [Iodidimonas gelatinilytica]|uniref:Methylenetetrahydrofolate reductase n=1 Tax=Iodidimonas gelatinilytica TaxID=1236966 RepID=A0A5A7MRW3_9PROT|nr:methylenetetrahydrofolate reductase [NAD(P)H] [Iodidimonas gelatinilytica]GEQ98687.1 methylenetetrahydrofolate reductase [Iodidimonas gelatinilytica]
MSQLRSLSPSLFADRLADTDVSFEFFPPKSEAMETRLWAAIKTLEPLAPRFVSVTYGAGGSTRERTHNTVRRLIRETTLAPAAHLTCVDASREEIDTIVRDYRDSGVRHIVALRGDAPDPSKGYQPTPGGYANAAELVAGIRAIGDFEISVAAYPECHPESASLVADLDNLKRKVDAGATRAITQFFFEADQYFRYLDHVRSYGIDVEITPGILPVTNVKQLKRFADGCGASVPRWMADLFEGLDDLPQTRALVAATVAAEMCRRLQAGGVNSFHFYTLNRDELTYAICHMLGIRSSTHGTSQEKAG